MSNYQVVIKGCKEDMNINHVLDDLAILFKRDPEKLRPLLMSGNLIAKGSLNLEAAKKYQKVLEDIGCIVAIESDLIFDDLDFSQGLNSEEPSTIDKIQANNEANVSNSSTIQQAERPSQHGFSLTDTINANVETNTVASSVLEEAKQSVSKKNILIIASVVLVSIGLASGLMMLTNKDKPGIVSEQTEAKPPNLIQVDITPKNLTLAYEQDAAKADSLYKGKLINVTAIVKSIIKISKDSTSIFIDGGRGFDISANFIQNEALKASALDINNEVIIQCIVDRTSDLRSVSLDNCSLIKTTAQPVSINSTASSVIDKPSDHENDDAGSQAQIGKPAPLWMSALKEQFGISDPSSRPMLYCRVK